MIGMYNDSSTCTILTERLIRGHVMRHRVSRIQIASSERMFSSTVLQASHVGASRPGQGQSPSVYLRFCIFSKNVIQ